MRFADTDRHGHITNSGALSERAHGAPLRPEESADPTQHPVRHRQARAGVSRGDALARPVEIGTRVERVGRSSVTLAQGLFTQERCVATAESIATLMDFWPHAVRRPSHKRPWRLCLDWRHTTGRPTIEHGRLAAVRPPLKVSEMQKLGNRHAANQPPSRRKAINGERSPPERLGGSELTAADPASHRPPRAHSVDERVKPTDQLAETVCCKNKATVIRNRNASTPREPLKRTVRRHQLRQMVPLADTTIYEMEQRGESPRRFYLTHDAWHGCCGMESSIEERRRPSGAPLIRRAPSPDVRKRTRRPVRR